MFLKASVERLKSFLLFHQSQIQRRDNKKREKGREDKPEDNRTAKCSPGFVGEGDGDDAKNCADRGDEDGFDSGFAGVDDGFEKGNVTFDVQVNFVDENDGVFDHDAKEREDSNETGKAEANLKNSHPDEHSNEGEGKGDEYNH